MIDIGLNLTSPQFAGEQADLVARARTAGVEALILTGTDLAGSRESAALAARWPGYWLGHNELGAFYFLRGRYDEALQEWNRVLQINQANTAGCAG